MGFKLYFTYLGKSTDNDIYPPRRITCEEGFLQIYIRERRVVLQN